MAAEKLRSADDFICDDGRQLWRFVLKELRESIEIGERVVRPLERYWSCHGRNRGVPHVRNQRTTRSCGTVG